MKGLLLLLFLALVPAALLQQDGDPDRERFRYERDVVLAKCADRHYDLGRWCWKNGLLPQCTAELLYALEISDQRHKPSKRTLAKLQALDEEFWQEELGEPRPSTVRDFHKRLERAREADLRDHLELAKWALREELVDEARGVYERLLRIEGEALELDDQGRIRVGRATATPEISAAILEGCITINGRRYLRDDFLANLPEVDDLSEASSDALRVRGEVGTERAEELHALGEALLPVLESELRGRPTRRMELFVFATRASYDEYLGAAGLERYGGGSGVADRGTYTALVCAEGKGEDDLRALFLHELTHLFHYGITRSVLPDWYEEGLAETYGGQGTFTWEKGKLTVGGRMADHRIDSLRTDGALMPLPEMLAASASALFLDDREKALRFYAQAWAFRRYMREGAGEDVAAAFRRWEQVATGAALGAEAGQARAHDPTAARALFERTFGADLELYERGFREYLATL